jgi:ACS family hexuronate transporter-like MFS transporter
LWSNWTTIYMVETFHMPVARANGFAWFPPVVSTLGAFAGGWFSQRAIRAGQSEVEGRRSALLVSGVGCLAIVATPFCGSPLPAILTIAASYFFTLAGSVNLYTIPVDIWGGERAGVAVSALVGSYGLLQTVVSPGIGWMVDRFGFGPVCWVAALPPLVAWWILRGLEEEDQPRMHADARG